jgi:hypothetical protein
MTLGCTKIDLHNLEKMHSFNNKKKPLSMAALCQREY